MIPRAATPLIHTLLQGFPVATVTGPRQSGKTTLARAIMAGRPCLSLEDPDQRAFALDDPRGFLAQLPDGGVLDEIQRAPELLSYVQTLVDADGRMGRFLLTGSQQLGLLSSVTQSLAGRSALVELLPFTYAELAAAHLAPTDLDTAMFKGGYPALYDRPLQPQHWFSAYVSAYVERDVRQLLKVQDLSAFQRFVRLCAGRSGQLLNLSTLAADGGITYNTAKSWISVLEASYVVYLLQPHHASFNKRLVKSPKLYFYDTGLLCWLLGIQVAQQLATHPLRGAIFETWVISELRKSWMHRGNPPAFYFWRDSHGLEIDLLIDQAGTLTPFEIKSGMTLNRDYFTSLQRWSALAGSQAGEPVLIYGGAEGQQRTDARVVGWQQVQELA